MEFRERDHAAIRNAVADSKVAAILEGWGRRRFLVAGGLSVATAALIASCGDDDTEPAIPQSGTAAVTTGVPDRVASDAVLLRTASSVEQSLIGVYQSALDSGVLSGDAANAAQTFQDHHRQHATFFQGLTSDAGGQPYTEPNPALQQNVIDPATQAITDAGPSEEAYLNLLYALEQVGAGTYQSFVPQLSDPAIRSQLMTVGGAEARHVADLAKRLPTGQTVPASTTATATTTTLSAGATTTSAAASVPVYQVPGAFGQLSAIALPVGAKTTEIELLGPNSFIY